jgi:predicted nucleic acid-binding protein
MDLVIDANILFAALVAKGKTAELLFKHKLYAPMFILDEFRKYEQYLKKKTKRTDEDFEHLLGVFERNIIFVSKDELMMFIKNAEVLSSDKKDAVYLALALKLEIPLWSNDKELKLQEMVKVYSTKELMVLDENAV